MSSFGGTVKLNGESDYKKALNEITSNLKVLNSEMKVVTSQYDKNDTSVENLSSQNEVLNKKIEEQEKKVNLLKDALAKSQEETGENSEKTKKWQTELNNAQADLNKLNKNLDDNVKTMEEALQGTKEETDAVEDFGEEAEKSGKSALSMGDIIKANLTSEAIIGGVKALANGVKAVAGAMLDFGKDVVNSYGELEQNLGGSEAVFGKYATNIQKIGEDAYKNLGVSQSDYLATANKMGALFQGSGIEQQKSLELTEKAMQRAADMASVMGIDMQVALDSVAGAAKGNFTMMDNLGVSMNATSIEAYAVGKGLDFVWAEASQSEKTEMAMQMFFENTTQYAGNFAKESTQTISGSFGLLKSSVESLMAGLGNSNADLVNLSQNIIDAALSVVDNVQPIIENIISALPIVLDTIVNAITEKLPDILKMGVELLQSLLNGISKSIGTVMPVVLEVIQTLLDTIIQNLPMIIKMGMQMLTSLIQGIAEMLPNLIPTIIDAVILIVETLIDNIDLIIDAGINVVMALAEGLLDALPDLVEKIPIIIDKLLDAIFNNFPKILDAGIELIIQLAVGLVEAIPQLVSKIPQITAKIVKGLLGAIPQMISAGGDLLAGLFKGLLDPSLIWKSVKSLFNGIIGGIKELFGIHSPSTVFADVVGKNLALGLGEGFDDTMSNVSQEMANAIPTEFDTDISTNIKSVSGATPLSQFDMMVLAFKQALTEVKVIMDDREMGTFVTNTVERVVFA